MIGLAVARAMTAVAEAFGEDVGVALAAGDATMIGFVPVDATIAGEAAGLGVAFGGLICAM